MGQGIIDAQTGVERSPAKSVRVATTANITLSGTQTIDAVGVVAGDRVLVQNQSTASQNGIYVVAAGAWSRATDADSNLELYGGVLVSVSEGTVNGGKVFSCTNSGSITIGTTAITFDERQTKTQVQSSGDARYQKTLGIVNVKADFGAVGDGVANDTAAFQAFSDYLVANPGRGYVPKGTYLVQGWTIPNTNARIFIEGAGMFNTGLKIVNPAVGTPILTLAGIGEGSGQQVPELVLKDMMLYSLTTTGHANAHGIDANHTHRSIFERVKVQGMPGDGIRFSGSGYNNVLNQCFMWLNGGIGVHDNGPANYITPLTLNQCRVEGNLSGNLEGQSSNLVVNGGTYESGGPWDIYLHQNVSAILTGVSVENHATDHPMILIGDSAEATGFPQVTLAGVDVIGHREGITTYTALRGIYIRKCHHVNIIGGLVNDCHIGIEATTDATSVVIDGIAYATNVTNHIINSTHAHIRVSSEHVIRTNADTPLQLRQSDVGSTAGVREAGINQISFQDAQGDVMGVAGFSAFADFQITPLITTGGQGGIILGGTRIDHLGYERFFPPTTQSITAVSNTIAVTGGMYIPVSPTSSLTLTSTPTIANGVTSYYQVARIINVSATNSLTLQHGTGAGTSNLSLIGGTSKTLAPGQMIDLLWISTTGYQYWKQVNAIV